MFMLVNGDGCRTKINKKSKTANQTYEGTDSGGWGEGGDKDVGRAEVRLARRACRGLPLV